MQAGLITSPLPPTSPQRPRAWLAYQELPHAVTQADWDDLKRVQQALRAHAAGEFGPPADLVEVMMDDARIGSKVQERTGGVLGLKPEIAAAKRGGSKPARLLEEKLAVVFPSDDLYQLQFWGLTLGVGLARVRWDTQDNWTPHLEAWHPRHMYYRWDLGRYVILAQEGPVVIRDEDPDWLLHTPYGPRRGWMSALVRRLAILWLLKQWTLRDWSRHNEVHGNPIRKAIVPAMADEEKEKDRFLSAVADLGSESVIRIVRGDTSGQSYDLELVEPKATAFETFGRMWEMLNTEMAIAVVGQNLTTEVTGGSRAAASVHMLVRADVLRADGLALERSQNRVIRFWTGAVFGTPDVAPSLSYPTAPPEDGDALAAKTDRFLAACAKATETGVDLDVEGLAKSMGVPLRPRRDGQPVRGRAIQEWHVTQGVVSPAEVREGLYLDPAATPERPGSPKALSLAAAERLEDADRVTEAGLARAGHLMGSALDSLLKALRTDGSLEAAVRWYVDADIEPLAAAVQETLLRAWALGHGANAASLRADEAGTLTLAAAGRPRAKALKYLQAKLPVTERAWKRLSEDSRRYALKVAGVASARMVGDVQAALGTALQRGWTFERFEREMGPGLRKAWSTSRSPSAPKTDEAQAYRLETIFRTATSSAYNAGRVAHLRRPANKRAMPYWLLSVVKDERLCPICGKLARPAVVLPADHEVWRRLIPPLHFSCRCTVVGLSAAQAKRLGVSARAPRQTAAEGFGDDPTGWAWKPDLTELPKPLAAAAKARLQIGRR